MSDGTESDDARMRRVLKASGISDHEGGSGDTYYRRPTWHMLDELADWAADLEQREESERERANRTGAVLLRFRDKLRSKRAAALDAIDTQEMHG